MTTQLKHLRNQFLPDDIPASKYDITPHMINRYPIYATPTNDHYDYQYYSRKTVDYISEMCTKLLKGVHPDGKNIIVSNENIMSVMESIFENNPRVSSDVRAKMVIAFIVDSIKTEFETIEKNNKLDIEVIKYTGEAGIRKTPLIKTRQKRPTPFIFQMKY